MLTLITGRPGTGKTAWTVQELTRLPSQRKLYVHGIPELKIAHEKIYCLSDQCDHCRDQTILVDYKDATHGDYQQLEELANPGQPVYLVEEWQHWATMGSLIVIDEVQRVWRPQNKVPDDIAGLETHRHKGLDFWLISQGPHLFHSNVRLLITRHIHLVADWKGRKEFEFPECRQNTTNRNDAVERPYKLPKKIFGLYKSSTLHIKQTHRKPLSYYFMLATLVVFFALLGFANKRWNERQHPEAAPAGEARAGAVAPPAAAAPVNVPNRPTYSYPDFKPKIDGVPESAPAYAELVKVEAIPHISSCAKTPDWCRCYSGRGAVYPTSRQYCEERIKGNYFDPWRPPPSKELKPYPLEKSAKPLITAKNP